MTDEQVLCASSKYEQKYFLNPRFADTLPKQVKDELQALMVLYTEDIGGILTLSYDDDGNLYFSTTATENDVAYDEIGAFLKIKQYQEKYKELLEDLEEYYQTFFL
ncbi:MAG: hypothetical protein J5819_07175 [Eubacterium sp.]|nr:hypothetical protein [Eubacterium sp.]